MNKSEFTIYECIFPRYNKNDTKTTENRISPNITDIILSLPLTLINPPISETI